MSEFDQNFSAPNFSTSLLEQSLLGVMKSFNVADKASGRMFIAIAAEAPACVPAGVVGASELHSLHVIQGGW
jgi:hypothetical protein